MKKQAEKLLTYFNLKRENIPQFIAFIVIVAVAVFFFNRYLPLAGYVLILITLSVLAIVTSILAGRAVMKALFWIGADLTLIIYLSQSYCAASEKIRHADDSLKMLLVFGLGLVLIKFVLSLYKEMSVHLKKFREINDNKMPWILLIPFALFTGLFLLQIYQVISPIILSLCVYNK